MYTTRQAARELRLSPRRIRQAAHSYGLGQKPGVEWLFSEADLETIRRKMGQVGRPSGAK